LAKPQTAITGVTAFEAYVHSLDITELSEHNAVIIETKRDDFYFQLFNGRKEKLCESAALNYNDIITILKGKTVTLIGNGVERFLDKPSGLVIHTVRMDKTADIKDIAACALQKFQNKKLNYPKPLYLRAPDVCVKS
jgi:tRNA A37 threonylcarbamoyladenosine modification protein TsaB